MSCSTRRFASSLLQKLAEAKFEGVKLQDWGLWRLLSRVMSPERPTGCPPTQVATTRRRRTGMQPAVSCLTTILRLCSANRRLKSGAFFKDFRAFRRQALA